MGWHFSELSEEEMRIEFSGYEFFADTNAVEAFVRETIQNSRDANPSPDELPTMVHFRFGRTTDEARDKHFEQGLPKHLSMTDALQSTDRSRFDEIRQDGSPPKWSADLDFLVAEEFVLAVAIGEQADGAAAGDADVDGSADAPPVELAVGEEGGGDGVYGAC